MTLNYEQAMDRLAQKIEEVIPNVQVFRNKIEDVTKQFLNTFPNIKFHTTNGNGKVRTWWLLYGVHIVCPNCKVTEIPIEEAWCGCKPIPRKLKKWCKGRRAVYAENL